MILGKEPATIYRYPPSTRDPDTGRTVEPEPEEIGFQGSFQPLDGKDREVLPEGVRHSETLKVYTRTALRTADQYDGSQADEVLYDGRRFVVYHVERYPRLLRHYKALLIRKQERAP